MSKVKGTETIISVLTSAGAAILVCVITQAVQSKMTTALLEYKIDGLTKRTDKPNGIMKRNYKLEERAVATNEKSVWRTAE